LTREEDVVILHLKDAVTGYINTLVLRRFRFPDDPSDVVSIEALEGLVSTYEEFEKAKEREEEDPDYPYTSSYIYIPLRLRDARKLAERLQELVK